MCQVVGVLAGDKRMAALIPFSKFTRCSDSVSVQSDRISAISPAYRDGECRSEYIKYRGSIFSMSQMLIMVFKLGLDLLHSSIFCMVLMLTPAMLTT